MVFGILSLTRCFKGNNKSTQKVMDLDHAHPLKPFSVICGNDDMQKSFAPPLLIHCRSFMGKKESSHLLTFGTPRTFRIKIEHYF